MIGARMETTVIGHARLPIARTIAGSLHRKGQPACEASRRSDTTRRILKAAAAGSSCSQTLRLTQPALASRRSVSISRALVPATFSDQKVAFVAATVWWSGHPCQKHPSRKTATWAFVKTRSAVRRRSFKGRMETRYRSPRACTADLRAISGLVSRPLLDFMLARTPGDEAQDSAMVTA